MHNTLFMLKLRKKKEIYPQRSIQNKNKRRKDRILYDEVRSVNKDKNTVICGDFNNPSVNWSIEKEPDY